MSITPYHQTTYETCLAVCLLHLAKQRPTRLKEIETWQQGWNFNFLPGQLNFTSRTYGLDLHLFVQNKFYANHLKTELDPKIKVFEQKITSEWISQAVTRGPIIIYLDNFWLQKFIHYPHFLLVTDQTPTMFTVIDSWDGQRKNINKQKIEKAIISLWERLGFSPVAVTRA